MWSANLHGESHPTKYLSERCAAVNEERKTRLTTVAFFSQFSALVRETKYWVYLVMSSFSPRLPSPRRGKHTLDESGKGKQRVRLWEGSGTYIPATYSSSIREDESYNSIQRRQHRRLPACQLLCVHRQRLLLVLSALLSHLSMEWNARRRLVGDPSRPRLRWRRRNCCCLPRRVFGCFPASPRREGRRRACPEQEWDQAGMWAKKMEMKGIIALG